MKKLKPHVIAYCTFCKAAGSDKVRAEWRDSRNWNRACSQHRPDLEAEERRADEIDGHHSEADYQTWMRL